MRRPLSLITTAVLAATSLVGLSQTAVSANSINDTTITRSTDVGPSAVPNAKIDRVVRITGSGKFLVAGRDSTNVNANIYVWRLNADLTIDNSFTPRDLGADFSYPTVSIASCAAQQNNFCFDFRQFYINEGADQYVAIVTRYLDNPTTQNQQDTLPITTVITGKLSTGEIVTTTRMIETFSTTVASEWASLNAVDVGRPACTSAVGATVNGSSLSVARLFPYFPGSRPDGSLFMMVMCEYTNYLPGVSTSVYEHDATLMIGLKQSGSTLVTDASFGTNGISVFFDDRTKCSDPPAFNTMNNSLGMNNLTDAYLPVPTVETARVTTVPNFMASSGVTSYDGCYDSWNSQSQTSKLVVLNVRGSIINTQSYPTGYLYRPFRWVLDPQGRWNVIFRPFPPSGAMNATPANTVFHRLDRTGKFDTTMGPNGMKDIQSLLPTSVTVNGTSVRLNYSIMGLVTTATGVMFTGLATSMDPMTYSCINNAVNTQITTTYYPYYLTPEEGLVTSFGTNGLGEPVSIIRPSGSSCSLTSTTFVTAEGQHGLFAYTDQVGAQSRGLLLARFGAAQGVTGGSDGTGAVAGAAAGRTDTKVYSRKLPTSTEVNTSLNVLTKKLSRTQMLRSRTPKVCVNLTQSVVLVKTGTCRLEVVDKASKQVVRRLSTRVRSTTSEVGTTVIPAENSIRFSQVSRRLSKSAKAQIAELAESAAEAKRIILVGHSAGLTENTVSNNRIALQRAAAVKAELQKAFKAAGIKVPISIASVGPNAPVTTKRTESAQARNRRVEVYVMP